MVNIAGGNYVFSDLNTDKTRNTGDGYRKLLSRKAKDADYVIYVWNLGGKPSTLSDFTGYNSVLSDLKAVKDGNVWCTTPDFFQIADTIGSMINDINLMLNADSNTTELTYLKFNKMISEVYSLKNLFIKETVTLRYNMTTS